MLRVTDSEADGFVGVNPDALVLGDTILSEDGEPVTVEEVVRPEISLDGMWHVLCFGDEDVEVSPGQQVARVVANEEEPEVYVEAEAEGENPDEVPEPGTALSRLSHLQRRR